MTPYIPAIAKLMYLKIMIFFLCAMGARAQQVGDFISIEPAGQTSEFIIPSTHRFQKIIETGDPLTQGGTLPTNNDFTGYVPISGSSTNGYLSINAETAPGGVSILDINYDNTTKLWQTTFSQAVSFSGFGPFGTIANCSGTVTPWNTIISCEEITSLELENSQGLPRDLNGDGYDDFGWCIEIDPVTKTVIDKRWALGNFKHENIVIHSNHRTVYEGADASVGYLYKFVADNAQDLGSGALFVYQGSKNGPGNWIPINNSTQAERNTTVAQSAAVNATAFNGIEDVEIGPDGWIYFAVKNESQVYRFLDSDPITGTTVPQMETFVGNRAYTIDHPNGTTNVNWGAGNDNLAFDGDGNLWVLQDGGTQNYIWVVANNHTQASPKVRIFGNTPLGSEPTGITFSPDYRFLFMSIQHPNGSNNSSQIDAAGNSVLFNKATTLVLARNENLGATTSVWYLDADGDGFATANTVLSVSSPGQGYNTTVLPTTDCDDNDAAINPSTVWYRDEDGDGYAANATITSCTSPGTVYTTTVLPTTDCDDNDPLAYQAVTWYLDADGDGYADPTTVDSCASPGNGYTTTILPTTDCNDSDPLAYQAVTWYLDADGDGYADPTTVDSCASPGIGYTTTVLPTTDCDDNDGAVNTTTLWYLDLNGDGYADAIPMTSCKSPGEGYSNEELPLEPAPQLGMTLYPNPSFGSFLIKMEKQYRQLEVSVATASNQYVFQKIYFETKDIDIDLSALSSGIYFLQLTSEGNTLGSFKVVRK